MHEKIGKFIGGDHFSLRVADIIIAFTLKCLWFIIFRFLG